MFTEAFEIWIVEVVGSILLALHVVFSDGGIVSKLIISTFVLSG